MVARSDGQAQILADFKAILDSAWRLKSESVPSLEMERNDGQLEMSAGPGVDVFSLLGCLIQCCCEWRPLAAAARHAQTGAAKSAASAAGTGKFVTPTSTLAKNVKST